MSQPTAAEVSVRPEFPLHDLIIWLQTAEARWDNSGAIPVTGRLEGDGINIYQDGVYRAAVMLDNDRPSLGHWADDDA